MLTRWVSFQSRIISSSNRSTSRSIVEVGRDPSPEGFVFPSEALTTPLAADTLWRRTMQPKLEKIGLGWATFQDLRLDVAVLRKRHALKRSA
jgi:hypothetical protein